jgi:hypothetical protein
MLSVSQQTRDCINRGAKVIKFSFRQTKNAAKFDLFDFQIKKY